MAFTTSALGLTIWNSEHDKYNYRQLADNWYKVEQHDHSPGKGNLIKTASIADKAITAAKIADGVISQSVQASSINTDAIVDAAVTRAKIANGSVDYSKLDKHSRMPIGTIIPWWHPTPTQETLDSLFGIQEGATTVSSWVLCDGSVLVSGTHDFGDDAFTVPDLQNKFILSASDTELPESTGGQNTASLAHTHTMAHTHQVPAHRHALADNCKTGSITHTHSNDHLFIQAAGPGKASSSNFVTKTGTKHRYAKADNVGNPLASGPQFFTVSGTAGVTSSTNGDAAFASGAASNSTTSSSLSTIDNRPSYIAITHIIKVKN